MMTPAVALIEDLLLVGDFDAAVQLVGVLTEQAAAGESKGRRQYAVTGIDYLVAGPMMRNVITHLPTIDEAQFDLLKAMYLSLGEVVVKPLAEALSVEERARPRQRLTSILVAFGAVGKRTAERLKSSPNPAVRRTAIYLLREFGGSDALPDLTELLGDNEPQVQREAVRAILQIGTAQSYQVLERALGSGTDRSREAIMQAVIGLRDERATPLFTYIVQNVSHRGPLVEVYLRAIESLGTLRDPEAIPPLKEALYRGEWWAPRRNAALRSAAAGALSSPTSSSTAWRRRSDRDSCTRAAIPSSRGISRRFPPPFNYCTPSTRRSSSVSLATKWSSITRRWRRRTRSVL